MKGGRFPRRTSWVAVVVAAVLSAMLGSPTLAERATPAEYSVTRHQISVPANHEFRFKTPTGVDASTDTILVTYFTGYDLGSIGVGDIDLFHGPATGLETSETLAAAPAAGVWGVTIASSSIEFTAPTDAAPGQIAPDDFVVIRIGTNAAGGVNQIVNPATIQLAQILLGGTFGDSALMVVPIVADDSVSVTATVPATSVTPPPGGGGGGGGDVTPPAISNVQAINITTSTATITWDTDEAADSEVQYGLTNAYEIGIVTNNSLVLGHAIALNGLTPGTTYHFRVGSRDGASNHAVSGDYTFTTLGAGVLLVISNLQVIDITDTSARVQWDTNVLSDSRVDYGLSTAYGSTVTDPGMVTSHSVLLQGLTSNTLYHFFVASTDQLNDVATSPDGTFQTLGDSTPPANVSGFTAVGGVNVVHLSWTMPPDPDLAGVRIVRRTDQFPTGPNDGDVVYSGSGSTFDDTNVTGGVTYYYGAFSYDTSGNFASGALAQATVTSPPLPPENNPTLCANGIDDDGNGLIDCHDPQCAALQVCAPPPTPVPEDTNARCSNGVDDDQNGLIDCADPSCANVEVCEVPPVVPPPIVPPPVVPTQPTQTPSGQVISISPQFYGAGGAVQLIPDASGKFGALEGSTVLVVVPISGLGTSPERAFLYIGGTGGEAYNLSLNSDGTAYTGTFVVPPGNTAITVSMLFQGGGSAGATYSVSSQGGGQVVEEGVLGQTVTAVPDATVRLFVEQNGAWVPWNGAPYGQGNPQITGTSGGFAFTVPNGRYYVEVEKVGFGKAVSSPQTVSYNVFGVNVGLIKTPPLPFTGVTSSATIVQNIGDIANNIAAQGAFAATVVRTFLQQPAVQQVVQNTISPALLGVTLVNIASALPIFNALAYLQFLFTQPILLFGRKRKKKWGVVYNSLTKQPVELAIVRLKDAKTLLILQTKVTDKFGRYSFIAKAGTFVLEIVKPGFVFPTQYLKDKIEDVDYADLYHGTPIQAEAGLVIALNIPLDPIVAVETPRRILWKKTLRSLQQEVALLTIVLATVFLIVSPSIQVALIVLAQVGLYLLFRKLAAPAKAKEWGIIFDDTGRKPLSKVIVRIFDKKFNKLLETQVTDNNGKYGFFVRRNVYYVTAEKEGYEKYSSPDIDLSTKDEAIVDQNIPLKKVAKVSA